MTTLPRDTSTPTHELAAWCRFADELLTDGFAPACPYRTRAMKRALARAHRRHLTELGSWRVGSDLRPPREGGRRAWAEIRSALRARDERVVRAACALIHRAVIAAYDRATVVVRFDTILCEVIVRQRAELDRIFRAAWSIPGRDDSSPAPVREFAHSLAS